MLKIFLNVYEFLLYQTICFSDIETMNRMLIISIIVIISASYTYSFPIRQFGAHTCWFVFFEIWNFRSLKYSLKVYFLDRSEQKGLKMIILSWENPWQKVRIIVIRFSRETPSLAISVITEVPIVPVLPVVNIAIIHDTHLHVRTISVKVKFILIGLKLKSLRNVFKMSISCFLFFLSSLIELDNLQHYLQIEREHVHSILLCQLERHYRNIRLEILSNQDFNIRFSIRSRI